MKSWPFAILTTILLSACQSPEAQQAAGGIATTSALLVAAPLVPLASAYHALTGDIEKEKEQTLALHAQFDPVYEQRMAVLRSRNPTADARSAFGAKAVAFLPHTLSSPVIGIGGAPYTLPDVTRNAEIIHSSDALLPLMELACTDPLDGDKGRWWSDTYRKFMKEAATYRSAFNQEMYLLVKETEPNKLPEPMSGLRPDMAHQ